MLFVNNIEKYKTLQLYFKRCKIQEDNDKLTFETKIMSKIIIKPLNSIEKTEKYVTKHCLSSENVFHPS